MILHHWRTRLKTIYTRTLTFAVPTFVGSDYSRLIICDMLLHSWEIAPRIRRFCSNFVFVHEPRAKHSSKTCLPWATHKAAGCTYSTILYVHKKHIFQKPQTWPASCTCIVASRHKHSFAGCLLSVTRHSPRHHPPWVTYIMKTPTASIDVSINYQVATNEHYTMETFSASSRKSPSCYKQHHLSCYILKTLSIICLQIGKMSYPELKNGSVQRIY